MEMFKKQFFICICFFLAEFYDCKLTDEVFQVHLTALCPNTSDTRYVKVEICFPEEQVDVFIESQNNGGDWQTKDFRKVDCKKDLCVQSSKAVYLFNLTVAVTTTGVRRLVRARLLISTSEKISNEIDLLNLSGESPEGPGSIIEYILNTFFVLIIGIGACFGCIKLCTCILEKIRDKKAETDNSGSEAYSLVQQKDSGPSLDDDESPGALTDTDIDLNLKHRSTSPNELVTKHNNVISDDLSNSTVVIIQQDSKGKQNTCRIQTETFSLNIPDEGNDIALDPDGYDAHSRYHKIQTEQFLLSKPDKVNDLALGPEYNNGH